MWVIPPFQVPDEQTHFFRAYQIAQGQWRSERGPEGSGGWLPASLQTLMEDVGFARIRAAPEQRLDLKGWRIAWGRELLPEQVAYFEFRNTVPYSPLVYLPQAAGIALLRGFEPPPIVLFYAGRLANLVAALGLTAWAIRRAPVLAWGFLLLALTPMAAAQRASLSADGPTNAIALAWVAGVLHVAVQRERLHERAWLALGLGALALGLTKQAYWPLVGLSLLIPVSCWGSRGRAWLGIGGLAALCLGGSGLWSLWVRSVFVPEVWHGGDMRAQLAYLRLHPLQGLLVTPRDFVARGGAYLAEWIGSLGWLDTDLPRSFIVAWCTALVATVLLDGRSGPVFRPRQRLVMLTVLVSGVWWMGTVLYLCCTRPGARYLMMQGRYLIPFGPVLLLLVHSSKAHAALMRWGAGTPVLRRALHRGVFVFLLCSSLVTLWVLWERFYAAPVPV